MRKVGEIYSYLDGFAPFHTAMDFDNAGLLVGDASMDVNSVIVSLDITPEVVKEAAEAGCELIISHHPVIFQPLKRLSSQSVPYLLVKNGISAICAHTNLDLAQGGVNTCLAARLGLKNIRGLKENGETGLSEGLVGDLPESMSPERFASMVKDSLGCGGLKYVPGKTQINTVALCGGAGSCLLFDAASAGADALVSADSKHHELLAAKEIGVTFVDAGHFCTEDVVIEPLTEKLREEFPDISFQKSVRMSDPAKYL